MNKPEALRLTDVSRLSRHHEWHLQVDAKNREISELLDRVALLRSYLVRYRDEVPLGHQPHMLAHLVDKALGRA
ncbi:MAG TPA: hypothetical protein VLA31_05120 [Burkholderiaceae bacterium]|nr:hypothetical protein [Burkholderiaceae bacterium]